MWPGQIYPARQPTGPPFFICKVKGTFHTPGMKYAIMPLLLTLAAFTPGNAPAAPPAPAPSEAQIQQRVEAFLALMTLDDKAGQMAQVDMNALQDKDDVRKFALG